MEQLIRGLGESRTAAMFPAGGASSGGLTSGAPDEAREATVCWISSQCAPERAELLNVLPRVPPRRSRVNISRALSASAAVRHYNVSPWKHHGGGEHRAARIGTI